jgi:hypothetical protein
MGADGRVGPVRAELCHEPAGLRCRDIRPYPRRDQVYG